MSMSQKYEGGIWKFSFLARYLFKAELYRYIYIVIFGKHLAELYWIVLMFLDPQCIVSQEDVYHLSCPYIQLGQERGPRNYENGL